MSVLKQVKSCFINAKKDEEKGKKHKGLLVVEPNHEQALDYIKKAKENSRFRKKQRNKSKII